MKTPLALGSAVAVTALGSALLVPAAAVARAGGPYVESTTSGAVVCRATTLDDRFRVQARAYQDTNGSNFFNLQVFENYGDVNLVAESFGESTWSAADVRGTGSMYDADGEPIAGEASLASAFQPSGEVTTQTGRTQEGNQRIVFETTKTEWTLTNTTVSVTGFELAPLDCIGNQVTETRTFTTPASYVNIDRSFRISDETGCNLELGGEVTADIVGRDLSVLVSFMPEEPSHLSGTLHLNGDTAAGDLGVEDVDGNLTGATVPARAQVTQIGPTITEGLDEAPATVDRRVTPYRLDLVLDLPSGQQSVSCGMELVIQRLRVDLPR